MNQEKLKDLRRNYDKHRLDESHAHDNPIRQFEWWMSEVLDDALEVEPNAMVLSTIDGDGVPAGRVVLLKDIDDRGFVFFTNYESHKGIELANHPTCSLTFWWQHSHRQVRIQGHVQKIDDQHSKEYFASRPLGSQLGALASPQSEVIADRSVLEVALQKLAVQYQEGATPEKPPHWGGYVVIPFKMEFWQGRENRLHDRLRYRLEGDEWVMERLAP